MVSSIEKLRVWNSQWPCWSFTEHQHSALSELFADYARLQDQLEAVTRELEMWQTVKHSSYWKARAARLEAALRRISDMCPATQEMTVAHMMADEAEAVLDVKEAG